MMNDIVLKNLYRNLYRQFMLEFPEDERPTEDEFVKYYTTDKYVSHHKLITDINYLLLWCELDCEVKVIEFFVVDKDFRNRGIGTKVFTDWLKLFDEHPKVMCEVDSEGGKRFWNRFGIKPVENFNYVQPPLSAASKEVTNLVLSTNFNLGKEFLDKAIKEWYKYGFGIEQS